MNSFSVTRKKTPFQKHREEEEAKKKRAEDETARLYAEFLDSFQGDNAPGSKAFVRGGTLNPNEKLKTDSEGGNSKDGVSVPKKGSRYVPSFIPPPLATKGKDLEKKKGEDKPREKEKGKSRNIDHFMEELKLEQEMRERRNQEREQGREGRHNENSAPLSRFDELPDDFDPSGKLPGSFDDGDPQTTNLYVGNLSPEVDENFLLRTFGRFGPIASVKIMWPRTEEERRRLRNCGFVAFMNRADGQAAKDEMQEWVVDVADVADSSLDDPDWELILDKEKVENYEGNVSISEELGNAGDSEWVLGKLESYGNFLGLSYQGHEAEVSTLFKTIENGFKQTYLIFIEACKGQKSAIKKMYAPGVVVYEYELKIGWGKSVSLPAQALPAPPPGQMAIRSKEGGTVILSGPDGPPVTSITSQSSELVLTPNVPDIMVVLPENDHLCHVIDTMALHVLDGGCAFEQAIMERGRGNCLFNFLFELGSKEHTYYVWRLYSFAQGDTLQRWRTEPFIMITGSGRWIPPPLPLIKSPEQEKESGTTFAAGRSRRVELERTLTDPQRDEFEDMLRALTLERSQIKEAMGFALDNADAAGEIVEVLSESLTLKETPVPSKVARLMLVSDVLHNSSAPVKNASAYRTKFEATLPDIMESFNDLYRSITGRITAEALKERILKVLQVWSDWFLFSDAYVNGLRATFLRSGNSGVLPFHSICGDTPEIENKTSLKDIGEGVKLNQDVELAMGKGAAIKELLNLPLTELERRCRHNGLSLVGGREMMVARLLSLEEAEKQKGYERDDAMRYGQSHSNTGRYSKDDSSWNAGSHRGANLEMEPVELSGWNRYRDGEMQSQGRGSSASFAPTLPIPLPELNAFTKKGKSDTILLDSKWAREDDSSDDEEKRSARGLGLSYSSSGSENAGDGPSKADEMEIATDASILSHPDSGMNEEQRQKLRRLEVALIEYRESLEERGAKSSEEIERKVEIHRRRLQFKFGLSEANEDGSMNYKHSSRLIQILKTAGRSSLERKDRRDDIRDSSRKRHHSQSRSPQRKLLIRDRERESDVDTDRERHRDKDRAQELETERGREREKSGSRERDDHNRDKGRGKDRRRGK
ncbi:hypothetical protein HHK36_021235 [Tetracentron sinense]|uniref:Protein RRC1-like n=1 Tax=Tetracentron sinense TaxID=13715 RepID=A0A834YPG2_TETSI|nr:hypothetical protein HHK36_021235 [Tetracentron sinense]